MCIMMKVFCVVYIPRKHIVRVGCCCRLTDMAKSLQGSFSLDEFEASVIENVVAVPNLDPNTTCFCRGHCLRANGRDYCPCRSVNSLCSRACHGDDFGYCMNNKRALEDDSDETVRLLI